MIAQLGYCIEHGWQERFVCMFCDVYCRPLRRSPHAFPARVQYPPDILGHLLGCCLYHDGGTLLLWTL